MKRFIEIIKYTWKAKGRHGIHSPFVYDLVDQCFRIPLKNKSHLPFFGKNLPTAKRLKLITQLAKHLEAKELASNESNRHDINHFLQMEGLSCAVQHLSEINQENLVELKLVYFSIAHPSLNDFSPLINLLKVLNDQSLIILDGIRCSDEHLKFWMELCAEKSIHFTADLYSLGLLSKRPQQEKEHFVLRY